MWAVVTYGYGSDSHTVVNGPFVTVEEAVHWAEEIQGYEYDDYTVGRWKGVN